MTITDENRMAAPCGTYCAICVCVKAKDNPAIRDALLAKGFPAEKIPCPGCREVKGECPALGVTCATWRCATERGVDFCHQCRDFPCERLNPAAHRAETLPHNIKIFHLAYQTAHGLEAWKAKAESIQERYYKGVMMIGAGPVMDGDDPSRRG